MDKGLVRADKHEAPEEEESRGLPLSNFFRRCYMPERHLVDPPIVGTRDPILTVKGQCTASLGRLRDGQSLAGTLWKPRAIADFADMPIPDNRRGRAP